MEDLMRGTKQKKTEVGEDEDVYVVGFEPGGLIANTSLADRPHAKSKAIQMRGRYSRVEILTRDEYANILTEDNAARAAMSMGES